MALPWYFWRFFGPIARLFRGRCYFVPCPWCGYDVEAGTGPWFRIMTAGRYNTAATGEVHWAEGVQTCPRCYHEFGYSCSS